MTHGMTGAFSKLSTVLDIYRTSYKNNTDKIVIAVFGTRLFIDMSDSKLISRSFTLQFTLIRLSKSSISSSLILASYC